VAVYAIGDVQGCYDELQRLLDALRFEPSRDRAWFVGDLVNRGPHSAPVLRFVRALGDAAVTVLGNHDMHLLALSQGNLRKAGEGELDDVLQAPDGPELIEWLRHRPFLHRDAALGYTMIHAGLPPQWDVTTAAALARELEAVVRGAALREYSHGMYGNKPERWRDDLDGMDRWRFITNCFTRLRFCASDGTLNLKPKGPPGSQPKGFVPWFDVPGRRSAGSRLLFGHWSMLGYVARHNVWSLDTGCLWGGHLTALRIDVDPPQPFHSPCPQLRRPGKG
jgi:bis(5'-nucleosyl)-tetraphosphatase (symmetrical)